MSGTEGLQPLLHDAVVVLAAPSQAWGASSGDIAGGVQGFYDGDRRILSELVVRVGGAAPEPISFSTPDAGTAEFVGLLRGVDDRSADPRIRLIRRRTVAPGRLIERLVLESTLAHEVTSRVVVRVSTDLATMHTVKAGVREPAAAIAATAGPGTLAWTAQDVRIELIAPGASVAEAATGAAELTWDVTVPAKGAVTLELTVQAETGDAVVTAPAAPAEWSGARLAAGDIRLTRWVQGALGDLAALRMSTRARPDAAFLAAGAPWFFTLFGRDSIWAARMLLPFGTDTARDTLRVLADFQGTKSDPDTAEQPGKIMHELRSATLEIPGEGIELPPLYYGTVDATALWVCLLADAWRWGLPDADVEPLLPAMEAALAWLRDYGDSDGDGFLEYVDESGRGLANQGWKDSGDSVQWNDGRLAEGPIALCEVQAYAYEAARSGADLLDTFGRPGGAEWRAWAARLKERFAEAFWVEDERGRYPAIALDAEKRPVDSLTSNIGHLLGTGLLEPEEARLVAERLVSPELNSGYGLRTMSTEAAGYWPLSYHGGSVWAHDTAIAITGLARDGFGEEAAGLAEGLLAAAEGFGYRMPELHSGDAAATTARPVPYPAACRPQAWSATASVAVLSALLGVEPDRDAGTLRTRPLPAATVSGISVEGLRLGGRAFLVTTGTEGHAAITAMH
ncbi:glycogen debranching N-terminal domain-containing protein [Naasia aerilata]|uniref:Amylo-alpha-1,6-glucosidase n=1 Tax=Naasia aerilata TaxID=1162966 RepID=A0ABN6XJY9_9MICO|nr:glycogen debranching N-terminal domain-containing protein [Naasia aerilata]BDZ45238.1 amylo-alpha-1,6-glucosidase [Naasia aerilata]